jgi:hypothetical protein
MKLYELDNEYLDFIAAVEDGTIPEDAIEDTLEMLNGDYKDKLDNTVCAIKNLTAEAKMIDEEIKALTARKRQKRTPSTILKAACLAPCSAGARPLSRARETKSLSASLNVL